MDQFERKLDELVEGELKKEKLAEEKLAVAIKHIAELQARQTACEGVLTLLAREPAALSVLSAARGLTVQTSSADAHDTQIIKLMTEQRAQDLIDGIETILRNDC
jgi:hypothetical protein